MGVNMETTDLMGWVTSSSFFCAKSQVQLLRLSELINRVGPSLDVSIGSCQ